MQKQQNNITTIIVLLLAVAVGVSLTLLFQPDQTKSILKDHEKERNGWIKERDSINNRIDSLLVLSKRIGDENEVLQEKANKTYNTGRRNIKKQKDEEINAINNSNDEYLRILSEPSQR